MKSSQQTKFQELISPAFSKKEVADLNESQHNVLRFCNLLVDIQYKRRYGKKLDHQKGKGYSGGTI